MSTVDAPGTAGAAGALARLTLVELSQQLVAGRISSLGLVEQALAAIDDADGEGGES